MTGLCTVASKAAGSVRFALNFLLLFASRQKVNEEKEHF
jgi:hypothetical protein